MCEICFLTLRDTVFLLIRIRVLSKNEQNRDTTFNGGFHGVSAAIEFAVVNLKVENVIVLGHRQCGGIRALMVDHQTEANGFVEEAIKNRGLTLMGIYADLESGQLLECDEELHEFRNIDL